MSPKVFVSHASEDKARFVIPFATALRSKGIDAWVDKWEMLPGDSLVDKIFEEGLKEAAAVVIVISAASAAKPWVHEELNASVVARISKGTKIIPVVLEGWDVPEALRSTVWENVPDPSNFDACLSRVVDAVFGHSSKPPLGSPPAYVSSPTLPAIKGLTSADVAVLSFLYESFVQRGAQLVSPASLVAAMKAHGIDEATVVDSLGVLEHQGCVEMFKTLGRGPHSSLIKPSGVSIMLGAKQDELVSKVGLCLLNQDLHESDSIADALGLPRPLVNHAIGRLESLGHVRVSKMISETVVVHTINPTLRRALTS